MADDDSTGFVPVSLKPVSRLGVKVAPSAKNLGNGLSNTGKQVGHRIKNGFLLRAVRTPQVTNVYILDPPANLLIAGWVEYSKSAYLTANNCAAPVGNRDHFSPPGYSGDGIQTVGNLMLGLGAPGDPPATDNREPLLSYVHMQPVVAGKYLVLGYMRIPTQVTYTHINTENSLTMFTDSNTVRVGCCYRDPMFSYRTVDLVSLSPLYEAQNSFWVSEGELPSGWKYLPRRYSIDVINTGGTKGQPTRDWTCWTVGANVIPASGTDGDNTDTFLMAVPVVNQLTSTWPVQVVSSIGYAQFYDQYGQRGLALLTGTLDITVQSTEQRYAALQTSKIILATDIDQAGLHPMPALVGEGTVGGFTAGDAYGPSRPNWVYFMQPQVQRCTDGFVTFCSYWAPYWATDGTTSTPQGSGGGLGVNVVTLRATLVIPPSGECLAVKGDAWCNSIGSYPASVLPVIADQNADYAVAPWIVGSESVPETDDQGTETITAYALVWEEHRSRLSMNTTIVRENTDQTQPTWRLYTNSWSIGGDWVMYSLESGPTPTRTILTNPDLVAPLFAVGMCDDGIIPGMGTDEVTATTQKYGAHQHPTYASMYYAGNNQMVTAGVDLSVSLEIGCWAPGATNGGVQTITNHFMTGEHDVYCLTIDIKTGVVTKRGQITTRDDCWYYCHITVAQPEIAASGSVAAKPAVLIATMFDIYAMNRGIETGLLDSTTTHISVDGGDTWVLYIRDTAGPNGVFLIGNQLWDNDVTTRFDEGLAG